MSHMSCAQNAQVDYIVFVNRHSGDSQELRPYRKDVARYAMQQVFYGMTETRKKHYETIERLLEGRGGSNFVIPNWTGASSVLQRLVREGR